MSGDIKSNLIKKLVRKNMWVRKKKNLGTKNKFEYEKKGKNKIRVRKTIWVQK